MKSLWQLGLVLFFLGLAVLEVAHGVFRLEVLRGERESALTETLERAHAGLAQELRSAFEDRRRHAAWLARSPDVLALLEDAPGSRAGLERRLLPYVISFPSVDRVRVLDAEGRDRFRCERIGGGAGALPPELLPAAPDEETLALARDLRPGEVVVTPLIVDHERVEVRARDRLVLNFVAPVERGGERRGLLVLGAYAEPLLHAVRSFEPFPGVVGLLLDGAGDPLVGPTSTEPPRMEVESVVLDQPTMRFVARLPEQAYEDALRPLRREVLWIVLSTVALTALLLVAGVLILRSSVRAARLSERAQSMQREREMERQLARQERLSSVGLLTAGVAHEINNPLEGIGNYLRLLEREGADPEKSRRYLERVRFGFERIGSITKDLLSFAKPTAEPGSRADLQETLDNAVAMSRYARELQGVSVRRTGLAEPLWVAGDAGQLAQVLLNLLLNAGRAMDGDGTIELRCERAAAPERVVVHVEDEGTGIAEEDLDRLFDPFFTRSGGTGLGLSVSYGIVLAHGGELVAGNREGGGARFTLTLPALVP